MRSSLQTSKKNSAPYATRVALTRVLRSNRSVLAIAGAILVLVGCFVPLHGTWVTDCGLRYLQLHNIVDRHHFGGFWFDYPLREFDQRYELAPFGRIQTFVVGERLFCQYPPWFSYGVAIFYALLGQLGMRLVPQASGILLLIASYGLARRLAIPRPAYAAAAVIFCAPILPYFYIFWDIVPALAAAVAGLYFALRGSETSSSRDMVLASFSLYLAFLMREEYLLWAGCVLVALALVRGAWSTTLMIGVPTFASIGIQMLVNHALIGKFLFFHASTGSGVTLEYSWALSTRPITAYLYLARVTSSQLSAAAIGDIILFLMMCTLAWLATTHRPESRLILTTIALTVALVVRFYLWDNAKPLYTQSYLNSAMGATPIFFAGLRLWRRAAWNADDSIARNRRMVAAVSVAFLLLSVWLSVPASAVGMNFGPRLLLPAYPGLLLAVCGALPHWFQGAATNSRLRMAAALFALLFGLGVVDNLIFLQRLVLKLNLSHRTYEVVRHLLPESPILTDQPWLASDPPELFYSRPILLVKKAEENPRLMDKIIALAKRLNPREALVLCAGSQPPAWIRSLGSIQRIPLEQKLSFPDGAFRTHAFRLEYRP